MFVSLPHHNTEFLIQLHNLVTQFLPLPQILPIRTFLLLLPMSLIPTLITFITKLTPTNTFHMWATHLLLNGLMTFRTFPCVIGYPTWIYLLRIDKLFPFLYILALRRFMWFLDTSETVQLPTWTFDQIQLMHVLFGTEIGTFFIWAVTNILVLNCVVDQHLPSVQLALIRSYSVDKTCQNRCFFTLFFIHTTKEDFPSLKFRPDKTIPTLPTIPMLTHPRRIKLRFLETDPTHLNLFFFHPPARVKLHRTLFEQTPLLRIYILRHLLMIPLKVVVQIETDIIVIKIDYQFYLGQLINYAGVQFLIFDELGLKLDSWSLPAERKLTVVAGIGVGVSQVEFWQLTDLPVQIDVVVFNFHLTFLRCFRCIFFLHFNFYLTQE